MSNRYHTAFWNVENLFAPENYRDRELRIFTAVQEDLRGWTEALFERKLAQLASIIAQMNGGQGPDLLGLCEVENRYVLDELLKVLLTKLPERRYGVVHADSSKDQRGIDTAFIYDVQRFSAKDVFDHTVLRRTGTREITQATFVTRSGSELIAMVNHWPSRSEGEDKTRGYRAIAGETVGWWHERIRDIKGADVALLVMGDFNDEPEDLSLTQHAGSTNNKENVICDNFDRKKGGPLLYNLARYYIHRSFQDKKGNDRVISGTYYFKNTKEGRVDANVLDQLLVSRGLLGNHLTLSVDLDSARIEAFPEQISLGEFPFPNKFGLPKRQVKPDGFSDHYPVSVVILER